MIVFFTVSCLLANLVAGGISWNGNNWAMSCDFRGNDLSNVRSSGEHCSNKCAQTNGCTHFAWNTWNGGTCWMKSGSVSKKNAFSISDRKAACGVLSEHTNQAPPRTKSKHFLLLTVLNCILMHRQRKNNQNVRM